VHVFTCFNLLGKIVKIRSGSSDMIFASFVAHCKIAALSTSGLGVSPKTYPHVLLLSLY